MPFTIRIYSCTPKNNLNPLRTWYNMTEMKEHGLWPAFSEKRYSLVPSNFPLVRETETIKQNFNS